MPRTTGAQIAPVIKGLRIVRRRDGGWGCGNLFRIYPDAAGVRWRLAFLRKSPVLSGHEVLDVVKELCRRLGGRELTLQDQATRRCSAAADYDLSFRERLCRGQTWYERQGFRAIGFVAMRKRADATMARYRRLRVDGLYDVVKAQNVLLQQHAHVVVVVGAFFGDDHMVALPHTALVRKRAKLERMLASGGRKTLAPWLQQLSCRDYAAFMRTMYGEKRPDTGATAALHSVGGLVTPSVAEFCVANLPRKMAHRMTYSCVIT